MKRRAKILDGIMIFTCLWVVGLSFGTVLRSIFVTGQHPWDAAGWFNAGVWAVIFLLQQKRLRRMDQALEGMMAASQELMRATSKEMVDSLMNLLSHPANRKEI